MLSLLPNERTGDHRDKRSQATVDLRYTFLPAVQCTSHTSNCLSLKVFLHPPTPVSFSLSSSSSPSAIVSLTLAAWSPALQQQQATLPELEGSCSPDDF